MCWYSSVITVAGIVFQEGGEVEAEGAVELALLRYDACAPSRGKATKFYG